MHFVYIDESYDDKVLVFSAVVVAEEDWADVFAALRDYRRGLKRDFGIYIHKELHARHFVSGRGRIADRIVFKGTRCRIFMDTLDFYASLPIRVFNTAFPPYDKVRAFERLLNRINRTMKPDAMNSRALLICDEGNEGEFTKLVRKMSVHNPIPSMYGTWESGQPWQNIPLDRIIEDPFFKDSKRSYFLQAADFVAYSLLRQENPLPSKNRYGLDAAFDRLEPVLFTSATRYDSRGILRP